MEPAPKKLFDTREILWKARRYRWMALVPIVATCCVAFLYLRMTKPVFESSVLVSLNDPTQVSAALEPLVRGDGTRGESISEKISRVRNRVLNRGFLQDLVQRTDFTNDPWLRSYSAREARKHPEITPDEFAMRFAVSLLGKKIRVEPSGLSNIRISLKDGSPARARQLAAAVADGLIEDTRRSTLTRLEARGSFSQDQIAVYTEKLRQAEDAYRQYQEQLITRQSTTGVVNAANVDLVRELQDAADKELDLVRTRIQGDRETWSAHLPGTPLPDLGSPAAAELSTRLNGLESSYGTAALRRGRDNEEAQTLLAQVAGVRQDLLREFESVAAGQATSLSRPEQQLAAGIALDRAVLRSIQARKDRLQQLMAIYLQQARATPREQMELDRLKNEISMTRDNLSALQKEATSSRMSEALETSSMNVKIDVVEAPVLPLYPVWPDRPKILAGAVAGGIFLAVVLILAMERVGAIVRTVEEAEEELGVKVIGTIPRIEGWAKPGSFVANHWAPLSIVALILITALVTGIHSTLTAQGPHAPRTDQSSR